MKVATLDEVAYEPHGKLVYTYLDDGKIDMAIVFSNECGENTEADDVALNIALQAWDDNVESVVIAPHFTIASPVDYLIEGHQMPFHNNAIDMVAKPIFDAIRAEMLAQIERIDKLQFKETP